MSPHKNLIIIITLCLACIFSINPSFGAKLYKWVDEKGNIFYSDQVPPEYSQHRRESLNKKGRVVGITERAKTKSEQALDRLLAALKEAQEKVITQQRYHDKALQITYNKLEDLQNNLRCEITGNGNRTKTGYQQFKTLG